MPQCASNGASIARVQLATRHPSWWRSTMSAAHPARLQITKATTQELHLATPLPVAGASKSNFTRSPLTAFRARPRTHRRGHKSEVQECYSARESARALLCTCLVSEFRHLNASCQSVPISAICSDFIRRHHNIPQADTSLHRCHTFRYSNFGLPTLPSATQPPVHKSSSCGRITTPD